MIAQAKASKKKQKLGAPKSITWINDKVVENILSSTARVTYQRRHKIDVSKVVSGENIGRLARAIDLENVERLCLGYENGNPFYMLVFIENPETGVLSCVSGDHRLHMCRKVGVKECSAYIVRSDDEELSYLLAVMFNANNGKPDTEEDRLQAAMSAIENYGTSLQEAASKCGISLGKIRDVIAGDKGRKRAGKKDVPLAAIIGYNSSHWKAFNTLADDAVFLAALAAFKGTMGKDVKIACQVINERKSESGRLNAVASIAKRLQPQPQPQPECRLPKPDTVEPPVGPKGSSPSAKKAHDKLLQSNRVTFAYIEHFRKVPTLGRGGWKTQADKKAAVQQLRKVNAITRKLLKTFKSNDK
jgi:hypothetical protein